MNACLKQGHRILNIEMNMNGDRYHYTYSYAYDSLCYDDDFVSRRGLRHTEPPKWQT